MTKIGMVVLIWMGSFFFMGAAFLAGHYFIAMGLCLVGLFTTYVMNDMQQ
jgi:hypothetical protein